MENCNGDIPKDIESFGTCPECGNPIERDTILMRPIPCDCSPELPLNEWSYSHALKEMKEYLGDDALKKKE